MSPDSRAQERVSSKKNTKMEQVVDSQNGALIKLPKSFKCPLSIHTKDKQISKLLTN